MMNRMKWLVAFGTLMFAAGCGPMEPEQTADAPDTGDDYTAAVTCAQKCQNQRNTCVSGCSPTSTTCQQGCRNRYEICLINCNSGAAPAPSVE
jgi:hypothetical protein